MFSDCSCYDYESCIISIYIHFSNATCEKSCDCSTDMLQPVCGSNFITYMSPCMAGCQNLYKNQVWLFLKNTELFKQIPERVVFKFVQKQVYIYEEKYYYE